MESPAETTSPGVFVALASPGEADDTGRPLLPRGALLYGAGVGFLVAIGLGTVYFARFGGQHIEWAKLAVHTLAFCVASSMALGALLDHALTREGGGWLASAKRAAIGGAFAALVPGAFALGHFARLRMEFIGVTPLALAGVAVVGLFAFRAACRPRGTRGYLRLLVNAAGVTLVAASTLAVVCFTLAALVEWPSEYEVARMLMVEDLRAAHLLDAFYYAVGALAGAISGAAIGLFVGLWGLGYQPPIEPRAEGARARAMQERR